MPSYTTMSIDDRFAFRQKGGETASQDDMNAIEGWGTWNALVVSVEVSE